MISGGAAGEPVDVGAACGFAERGVSLGTMRVPPEDGGTLAGTHRPLAVRCAGT